MIHQRVKDIFFSATRFITRMLVPFYRFSFRQKRRLYLNLGSGADLAPGFVNIDGNPLRRGTIYLDLRTPLPFEPGSVEFVFTSNMIEHLFVDDVLALLRRVHNVLQDGGILRIVVPDLEKAVLAYQNKKHDFFPSWPRNHGSLGGRFSNFMFCDGQHRLAFDFEYLRELLIEAGFDKERITKKKYQKTATANEIYSCVEPFEKHRSETNLFVEVSK